MSTLITFIVYTAVLFVIAFVVDRYLLPLLPNANIQQALRILLWLVVVLVFVLQLLLPLLRGLNTSIAII